MPPRRFPHLRDPGRDGILIASVERQTERARAHVGCRALCALCALRVTTRHRHTGARGHERPGHREPKAAGRARDQRAGTDQRSHTGK